MNNKLTSTQIAISEAVFISLKREINNLTWWDKLAFKDALDDSFTFNKLNAEQQGKFLRIAMEVVKALSDRRS